MKIGLFAFEFAFIIFRVNETGMRADMYDRWTRC